LITVRCLHSLADAGPWRDAINALNLVSDRPDPFASFEFYRHCLDFPADQRTSPDLWLLLAHRDEALVGCLALKRSVDRMLGWPVARLTLLTAHRADRPRLVARAADAEAVADAMFGYLLGRQREWSLLEFQQQDPGSSLAAAADRTGHTRRQWPNESNASIAIRWPDVESYCRDLHRKQRGNLKRGMHDLMAAGTVQCLSSDRTELTPVLFHLYRDVERRSWKAATPTGFDDNRGWRDYYEGLLAGDSPMRIRIDVVLLDGEPIAGLVSGQFANSSFALHIAHDERHAQLSPGSTVLFLGVQRAIAEQRDAFHLLWGYGYYKRRWLAELTETRSVQIYRNGSLLLKRRQLGDLRRRLRGDPVQAETTQWNPARQTLKGRDATGQVADHADRQAVPPETRARQRLLARGFIAAGGECRSVRELAALLPSPGPAREASSATVE
jgi:hypothetical protein